MTWAKIDDGFPQHPKVIGLSDAAFRLHVTALAYCSRHLTDGELPEAALPTLYPRNTRRLARELVDAGLWHDDLHDCGDCPDVVRGRYYLHAFLEYNPPAEEVEEARSRRSEKAKRAARARWDKPDANAPSNAPSNTSSIDEAGAEQMLQDAPGPARPVLGEISSLGGLHGEYAEPEPLPPDEVERRIREHRWAPNVTDDEVNEAIFVLRRELIPDEILLEALAGAEAFPSKWRTHARDLHARRRTAPVPRTPCPTCGLSGLILDDSGCAVPCPDCRDGDPPALAGQPDVVDPRNHLPDVLAALRPDHQEATA